MFHVIMFDLLMLFVDELASWVMAGPGLIIMHLVTLRHVKHGSIELN